MSAQLLTRGHESFHDRLARIERSQFRKAAGGRAASRIYLSPIGKRSKARGRAQNIVLPRKTGLRAARLTLLSYLKCWSYGFLIGGFLTLAHIAFASADMSVGLAGVSPELLQSGVWGAYLCFFLVVITGLTSIRQKPAFAQFSLSLGATMLLGLF